jgi:two-component system, OmpR family, sensor kinase
LPPNIFRTVFDRFYRVDTSRSRVDGHAGLGLAICKTIVDAERGSLTVESSEGVGTTFEVRLASHPPATQPADR